ncbi:Gfo/Idh/MocA family oxidoreductase [bacterium]|nr:Gfo/Idh/MocA family oxidoreductase [bacterium]
MGIKIAVIGLGHLGWFHSRTLARLETFDLVGGYDLDRDRAEEITGKLRIHNFNSIEELLKACEAVVIATPTSSHHKIGMQVLTAGKHLLVEKPLTDNLNYAKDIVALAERQKLILQVGHTERFNPAFQVARKHIRTPYFIEAHRLCTYNPRSTDINVIFDLMIHDIDLALSLIPTRVTSMIVSGAPVVSKLCDIASARLRFENGSSANLTASRISLVNLRKFRVFQEGSYISIDMAARNFQLVATQNHSMDGSCSAELVDLKDCDQKFYVYNPEVVPNDAIEGELLHFAESIGSGREPIISGKEALRSVSLAAEISSQIEQ